MKYLITIILLFSIALAINCKISNDIKWQRKAIAEWNRMLDPMYTPPDVVAVINQHKACKYIFEMAKEVKK